MMTTARIQTRDMLWNTALTFGWAFIGGATGWVVSKIGRRFLNSSNPLAAILGHNVSTFIPILGVSYLASRVNVMTFPFDKRFRGFYSLHPLIAVSLCMLSAKVYNEKRQRMCVICLLTAELFLISIAVGTEKLGPLALAVATLNAGVMAAVMPLYPKF